MMTYRERRAAHWFAPKVLVLSATLSALATRYVPWPTLGAETFAIVGTSITAFAAGWSVWEAWRTRPRPPAHVGFEEHSIGIVPDCPGCQEWLATHGEFD
jgi:hypothetical protein